MTHTKRRNILGAGLAAAIAALAPAAGYSQSEPILIGNTMPYSGPASSFGLMGETMNAYFTKVNDEGGINGRMIEFISYDDAYSPPKTVEQTRRLVERDEVLTVFGSLGTPTNSAVHDYLNNQEVPQLFVASGASKWNDPEGHPWTMGFQPDYYSSGLVFGKYILDNYPDAKIGFLYQNDDFGKDYLNAVRAALKDHPGMLVAEQSFETTDPTVDSQVINLKASGADVFINIASPKFAAQAIRKAAEIGWTPLHFLTNASASVNAVLEPAGLEASTGIITVAYYKDPGDPTWADDPEFADWSAFMDEYLPDGDRTSANAVWGYAWAKALEVVLRAAGDDLSRENLMKQAASLTNVRIPMLLPGIELTTGPDDFAPIESMQLMRFNGERWELFGDVIDVSGL